MPYPHAMCLLTTPLCVARYMLELLGKYISDVFVLRKIIFAAVFLPPDISNLLHLSLLQPEQYHKNALLLM